MKQVKFKFPAAQASAFATYSFEKAWRILISYTEDDFFGAKLVVIMALQETQVAELTASEWAKYIVKD